jgi:DNA repair ATPase RecN
MSNHILRPTDLPQAQKIIAGITPAKSEAPVDHREPATLKHQLESANWFLGELMRDLDVASRATAEAADRVSALQKLKTQFTKNIETVPRYKHDPVEVEQTLSKAEQALAVAKRHEHNLRRRVAGQKQGIAEFLKYASNKMLGSPESL